MERAFDDVAVDETLGEPGLAVGAGVVGGVEVVVQIVDRDRGQCVGLDPHDFAGVDVTRAAKQGPSPSAPALSRARPLRETGPRSGFRGNRRPAMHRAHATECRDSAIG